MKNGSDRPLTMRGDEAMHSPEVPPPEGTPRVWAVVATYRRPAVLANTLRLLGDQSRPPDSVLVVDNGREADAEALTTSAGATYVRASENVGPAGAFTLGVASVLDWARLGDWILFVDDDDPPTQHDDIARLISMAVRESAIDVRVAGVGLGGSRYLPSRGTFQRLQDADLNGPIDVDTLFGGYLPMYRAGSLAEVKGPDPSFFWGFEEAELGLHLRSRGYRLVVDGERFAKRRASAGVPLATHPGRTPLEKAGWRRYYSVRNSTALAKRYARWYTVPYVAFGGAAKGCLAMLRMHRPPSELMLPLRGAFDGLVGRLGRRVDPGENIKTVAPEVRRGSQDGHST